MAILYSSIADPLGEAKPYSVTDEFLVTEDREYVSDPKFSALGSFDGTLTPTNHVEFIGTFGTGTLTEYDAYYIDYQETVRTTSGTGLANSVINYIVNGDPATASSTFPQAVSWAMSGNFEGTYSTNIPIFAYEDMGYYNTYIDNTATLSQRNAALKHAINYKDPSKLEEETTYEFSTIARNYTVDQYGNITENEAQGEKYVGLRIKTWFKTSLYKIPGIDDGKLKYGINMGGTPTICYYSDDYGKTWKNVPGSPTTLPFNYVYRPYEEADGQGTFWAAVGDGNNKNLFVFEDEADSNEYNAGDSDGRKAGNFNQIISGDFDNPTGDADEETDFSEVYTKGFFCQQYIMDSTALQALANDLYDTTPGGIWEDMVKGLGMYGDNPIECVMGLSFWPVTLSSVFTNTQTATSIWFGGYQWNVSSGTALKILTPNGYKSLGSVAIRRTFRNWRDWSPYSRLYVSLPYCGKYELDLTRYYDKTVEVRYFFDTRSNGCVACLLADGHLMDYFNGQAGVSMPITLTDFSSYANAQIQTLLGFGGQAINTGASAIGAAPQAAAMGAGGAALGLAGVGVAGAALGAKSVYGLTQNNINKFNTTKGSSSSMINEYLPQYVEFTFEIQEDCAPDNYGEQYGYPSMKSGAVGNFQGFLKCQSVKLNCGVATEQEKNQIKTLLLNGIYI